MPSNKKSLEGAVNGWSFRAAGAGRLVCAPTLRWRFWAAPQPHR
jgi:hypothetical protein